MNPRRTVIIVLVGLLGAHVGGCASVTAGGLPKGATGRALPGGPSAPAVRANWPTYHGNPRDSGLAPAGTRLLPLRRAWRSPQLDGQLYAEPLVQSGRVVTATENDTVYVLTAATGHVLWKRHLATAVPSRLLACGDISPKVGITDTPVIDPARREIFVEADQLNRSGRPSHHLYGLDLGTGEVELDRVVDPAGSHPAAQLQRPGLALDRGRVLIAFGGNVADCGTYHGYVVSAPERGGRLRIFEVDSAQGEQQGAIWMGGAAPVVDRQGNVWVATGNGSVTRSTGRYDHSDAVIELSPQLRIEQLFAPATWASDNANDLDLASTNPALIHGLVVIAGKGQRAYLLRQHHLGGIGGQVQTLSHLCNIYTNPDGGDAVAGSTVYIPCQNGVEAIAVTSSPPHMAVRWTTSTAAGGPPIVAGGLIWTIDQSGTLWGLNPRTGAGVVHEALGGVATHFPTPAVGDGLLLAPSTDRIVAFAGPDGAPPSPPRPTRQANATAILAPWNAASRTRGSDRSELRLPRGPPGG